MVVGLAVPNVAQAATPPPTAAVGARGRPRSRSVHRDPRRRDREGGGSRRGRASSPNRYDAGVLDVYDTAAGRLLGRIDPGRRAAPRRRPRASHSSSRTATCRPRSTDRLRRALGPGSHRRSATSPSTGRTRTRPPPPTCTRTCSTRSGPVPQRLRRRVEPGIDFVDGGTPDDCSGHGTHVTGTLGGTTLRRRQGVRIVPVRVLDCEWPGHVSKSSRGVNWVRPNAVAGGGQHEPGRDPSPRHCDNAIDASIIVRRGTYTCRGQQP